MKNAIPMFFSMEGIDPVPRGLKPLNAITSRFWTARETVALASARLVDNIFALSPPSTAEAQNKKRFKL